MKRVLVTGIGAVTPLGSDFHSSWSAVKKGLPGIAQISRFDPGSLPWRVAGEIKSFEPPYLLSQKELRTTDPFVQYALSAAMMASLDAGIDINREFYPDSGVIIGSSRGGISTIERELKRFYSKSVSNNFKFSPYLMPSSTIGIAASIISEKLRIKGICFGISCACSSGAVAIGEAYRIIKEGYAKIMLAGGADAPICELCVIGYGSSGALSKRADYTASRPFAKSRDGFVLSEGASVLVLEEYEHAINRDAHVYGEIIGYSNRTDAHHITRPYLEGEIDTIELALKQAKISPEEVDCVSAHATSTPLGDLTEAEAIKRVFRANHNITITAIKSLSGHMLAASGAFEIACALMSIKEGLIPPTINLFDKDPFCDIEVNTKLRSVPIEIVLTNSFGFGGINAVLIMRKFSE